MAPHILPRIFSSVTLSSEMTLEKGPGGILGQALPLLVTSSEVWG